MCRYTYIYIYIHIYTYIYIYIYALNTELKVRDVSQVRANRGC